MKRFLLVMLALGLITAFSTTAFAADVKVSGQYYAAGMYVDKTSLKKDYSNSTAFYFQLLRVRTDFIVSPGLTLVTRFEAMERAWGAARGSSTTTDVDSAGTIAENENIAFDWAYINYKAPIGVFNVGIMNKGTTGTAFGNNIAPAARIKYAYTYGPVFVEVQTSKLEEKSYTAKNTTATWTDADRDEYGIEAAYSWKGGKAGVNVTYNRDARKRPTATPFTKVYWQVVPYAMAKIGPVALEAELGYVTGKEEDYDNATTDVKMTGLSGYVDALADFGMFYAGGTFAYVSGDKPGTAKKEGGTLSGGRDWNPCLILFSYYDTYRWAGPIRGWHNDPKGDVNNAMANAFFYQGRVGVRPIADLNIMASLAYAYADKKPSGYLEKDYGMEFDVTATYKITNNLSYMLGAGYLWTGDYFKYDSAANKVDDNFMVINKLTLTF